MPATRSLSEDELLIDSPPIAQGKERTCYLHPVDATKIIKVSSGDQSIQSKREIEFYVALQKRPQVDYSHLPRFYGTVQTNLGQGLVLDLICDNDGGISKSLQWYLENGIDLSLAESRLRELKDYLLENLIIFNHDMYSGNLLLQQVAADSSKLVVIDGLGDVVSIPWLNRFPFHVRSKIERRWKRFMKRYYNNPFVAGRKKPDPRAEGMRDPNQPESEIEISVIVPVYNVAPFVEACLQSIDEQSFTLPYEALLIDDCSTDGGADICRNFVSRHPRKFSFLQNPENLGVSVTRNRGLEVARGRFFMFVDPDDLLTPNALADLYDAVRRFDCDIVKGNNSIFDSRDETPARYNVSNPEHFEGENVLTVLYEHEKVRGHPWGKLFRRDTLGSYRFPARVRMAQDLFYCSEVFSHANSLMLLDRNVYRYRNRETGSTGGKFKSGSYHDWLDSVENTAHFAHSKSHFRAHKKLLVRTMTQLARECRKLPPAEAEDVLATIHQRCERWQIRLIPLLIKDRLGLRSLARYIKMRLAIRETRRALLRSRATGDQTF